MNCTNGPSEKSYEKDFGFVASTLSYGFLANFFGPRKSKRSCSRTFLWQCLKVRESTTRNVRQSKHKRVQDSNSRYISTKKK